jgi:hypothetical protein
VDGGPTTVVSTLADPNAVFSPTLTVTFIDIFGNPAGSLPTAGLGATPTVTLSATGNLTNLGPDAAHLTQPLALKMSFPGVNTNTAVGTNGCTITMSATGTITPGLFNPIASLPFSVVGAANPCRVVVSGGNAVVAPGVAPTVTPIPTISSEMPTAQQVTAYFVDEQGKCQGLQGNGQLNVFPILNVQPSQIHINATAQPNFLALNIPAAAGQDSVTFTLNGITAASGQLMVWGNDVGAGNIPLTGTFASIAIAPGAPDILYQTQTLPGLTASGWLLRNVGIGKPLNPIVLSVRDSDLNVVTSFNGPATLSGAPAGVTFGTTSSLMITNGVATIPNVTITGAPATVFAGSPYTVSAVATLSGIPDTATPFNVTKVLDVTDATQTTNPAQLVFLTQPKNMVAGAEVGAPGEIQIQIADVAGTPVKIAGTPITLDVEGGVGASAFTYRLGTGQLKTSTTLTVNTDANGIAHFIDQQLQTAAVSVTIAATSPGLNTAGSKPFDVLPAAPASTAQPAIELSLSNATPYPVGTVLSLIDGFGIGFPTLQVLDAFGNVVTNYQGSVGVSIAPPGPVGAGVLTGTLTKSWTGGVAVFDDLKISGPPAVGYQLHFAASGLQPIDGTAFDTQ